MPGEKALGAKNAVSRGREAVVEGILCKSLLRNNR